MLISQSRTEKKKKRNVAPIIAHLKDENKTTDVLTHRNDHFEAFSKVFKYYTNINTNNIS